MTQSESVEIIPILHPLTWEVGPVTREDRQVPVAGPEPDGTVTPLGETTLTDLLTPVRLRADEGGRVNIAGRPLLDRFCPLATADTSTIHGFAQRFGLLQLCAEHSLPGSGPFHSCSPRLSADGTRYIDEVGEWRRWARRLGGTLTMAAAIREGKPPLVADIRDAFDVPPRIDEASGSTEWGTTGRGFMGWMAEWFLPPGRKPHVRRWRFEQWINTLLAVAEVGPILRFRAGDWRIEDGISPTSPLFGALVLELAYRCAQGDVVRRCDECQTRFTPRRASERFCPDCRELGVAAKWATRAHRARLRVRGFSARGRPLKR